MTKGEDGSIDWSMQLIEGRVGQEYNLRKNRRGSFWQDRHQATAVQTGFYLQNCMTYVGMNRVRAGVVKHSLQWMIFGFQESQGADPESILLNLERAAEITDFLRVQDFTKWQREVIQEAMEKDLQKDARWTPSLAMGDLHYYPDFEM